MLGPYLPNQKLIRFSAYTFVELDPHKSWRTSLKEDYLRFLCLELCIVAMRVGRWRHERLIETLMNLA